MAATLSKPTGIDSMSTKGTMLKLLIGKSGLQRCKLTALKTLLLLTNYVNTSTHTWMDPNGAPGSPNTYTTGTSWMVL